MFHQLSAHRKRNFMFFSLPFSNQMESVGVNLEVRNDPASLTFSIPERPHVSESGSLTEPPDNEANKQIL